MMNGQKFVYEHFDNLSYTYAWYSFLFVLFLLPINSFVFLLALLGLFITGFVFIMFRTIKFLRQHKNIPSKEQKQMIKRHRFSLKWLWLILGLSILASSVITLFFKQEYVYFAKVSGLIFMLSMFIFLRVFLRGIQSRMNLAPLNP